MHLKCLVTHFEKVVIVHNAMNYNFGDIRVWSWIILLVSIFFYILIAGIPWMVAQTPIERVKWELSDAIYKSR